MPSLNWIGKKAVENHHRQVPFHLLQDVPELSVGEPGTGNLLVEGDNLLALKALLPYYAGQVKCIYIDPPYNTGEENWIYNDNVNSHEISNWLGKVVGGEFDDLTRHDKWLCMMYPRLTLLKEFLRDDGSIWVSIDDTEVHHLRNLMDEIFGRDRFVASNVWQKRYSRENREAIGDVHEYIVVYAKHPALFKEQRNRVSPDERQMKVYKNPNNDPRGRWRPIPMTAQEGHATPDQFYEIVAPGGRVFRPPKGRCWALSQKTFEKLRAEGRIYFGKNGNAQPNVIRYLSEIEGFVPWTWWPHEEVGHTDEAKKEIHALMGKESAFETPKPLRLLKRILEISTKPGDLVLDSFAGTGTTGHATLLLNNQGGDNRHFVLIEMDPDICRKTTAKRLRLACEGYPKPDGSANDPLGGGFRYATLGDTLFDERGSIRATVRFSDLARHVYFTETGEPLSRHPRSRNPLIGVCKGIGVYLLYNGILKDKSPGGGNVLTTNILTCLPKHDGPKVVYGTACRIGSERLRRENIVFKQLPYKLRVDAI
jgi:adenine-specific DNA-methyltransferase